MPPAIGLTGQLVAAVLVQTAKPSDFTVNHIGCEPEMDAERAMKMKMKVRTDNTMRSVSIFTVRSEFSRSLTMLNRLTTRLSRIRASRTTIRTT